MTIYQKMLILLSFFFVSISNISFSQSDDNNSSDGKSTSQYLHISFINETALYYHYPINEKLSIKSGFSVLWNYEEKNDGEGNYKYQSSSSPSTEQKSKSNNLNSDYEVILSSQILYSLNDYEYARIYLAIGPSLGYSLNKYSSNSSNYTDTTYSRYGNEANFSTIGIGPSLSFLFKSHIHGGLYLVSEYNVIAYYTWNTDNSNSRNEYKSAGSSPYLYANQSHQESNGWKMKFSNIRVGLLIAL